MVVCIIHYTVMIFSLVARVNDSRIGLGSRHIQRFQAHLPTLLLFRFSQTWLTVYFQFHIAAYAFSVPKADLDIQTLSMTQW
jgi:hypothetical protein